VPDIQSLTLQVNTLNKSINFWNLLMLWGLAGAFIAAGTIAVATRIVITRSSRLGELQSQLSAAKDRQLKIDLHQKELEIVDAKRETARLEAAVAGRQITPAETDKMARSLRRFAGRSVYISSYSGDAEAARLGIQIMEVLEHAGIKVDNEIGRTVAGSGGVAFGIALVRPPQDDDMAQAISSELRETGKLDVSREMLPAKVRMGEALTGLMVGLKPIANTKRK
jgi:hypothetical protein